MLIQRQNLAKIFIHLELHQFFLHSHIKFQDTWDQTQRVGETLIAPSYNLFGRLGVSICPLLALAALRAGGNMFI